MLNKSNPKLFFFLLHVCLYMQLKYVLHVFFIHAFIINGEVTTAPNVRK